MPARSACRTASVREPTFIFWNTFARWTCTVRVEMTDNMRFTPAEIRVKRGEIVRFVPTNKGQVMHEMVLGTMDELRQHAAHIVFVGGERFGRPGQIADRANELLKGERTSPPDHLSKVLCRLSWGFAQQFDRLP